MTSAQLSSGGFLCRDLVYQRKGMNTINSVSRSFGSVSSKGTRNFIASFHKEKLSSAGAFRLCSSAGIHHRTLLVRSSSRNRKKGNLLVVKNFISSETAVDTSDADEDSAVEENCLTNSNEEVPLTESSANQPQISSPKHELIMLSLPAIAGQALDPLAQLMETAYIGRLGPVELASAGVSMSVFNIISKLFNMPLLSVATSFVAEDIAKNAISGEGSSSGSPAHAKRQQLSSVSSALLLAVGIGIFEASALALGSGLFLNLMGISPESSMRHAAQKFLRIRAIGAPALVVNLALQGVFRGFKDTKTPVFCLGAGNFFAIFLFPLLMYYFKLGMAGAAISTVVSQYIVASLMIWHLSKRVELLPPKMSDLQFGCYVKSGGFLLWRTLAVLITMTTATSMATRQGPVAMAAHQICLQVWLAVSLLTDALASSGQALIASSISRKDYRTSREITDFVLKIGAFTGVSLAAILGVSFSSLATLFTKDIAVLDVVKTGLLFVCASQPLNALAYIFDGLHYGVSDFPYAATSMVIVGAISTTFLLYAPSVLGLQGVWAGLALFMGLRTLAGYIRLMSKNGPWWFMHEDLKKLEPVD